MPVALVTDPDAVAALSASVADQIGIPAEHVEKDFWVTEVLRGVTRAAQAAGVEVVFKGGTSLSKAFSLIQRFSEDVDILVILSTDHSAGARDRILKGLIDGAVRATTLDAKPVPEATSKGAKRGARFHYRPRPDTTLGGLSSGVFLELGSRGGGLPSTPTAVASLLAQHAANQIEGTPEAEPVHVRVLAPCRTLVEKLVLLHTAHTSPDPKAAIRGARHYYDVHQLLARPEIVADIGEHGIAILARDVCTYSHAADMPARPRPTGGFAASPAFTDSPHLAAARAEYDQRVLAQLVWPTANRPSFDACMEAVHRSRELL
ncbi:nucleotidyl transferase AbiEii/AbiGii toxin family protein [Sporichthya sp.]|uniref:nucleotidyl transferase AbiEii/AbiGii toxin family protein n=1 Tax=Sporichthya sp. TaxID=65475 RepID=UPI0018385AE0|nr:nucleotidyl transferase AbiEii/AbiGii toxin family protein [Sporichthya sp.]MBA3741510.1 nucleotidyl transferase AbiEii/AbiGii toxin family protein [Sporichthya sp.]